MASSAAEEAPRPFSLPGWRLCYFKAAVASLDGCVTGRGGGSLSAPAAAAAPPSRSSLKSLEGVSFAGMGKARSPAAADSAGGLFLHPPVTGPSRRTQLQRPIAARTGNGTVQPSLRCCEEMKSDIVGTFFNEERNYPDDSSHCESLYNPFRYTESP